jgi:hypothetical protein
LITKVNFVVAAHCFLPKNGQKLLTREALLLIGAHNLSDPYETDRVLKAISEVLFHDDWNPNVERYDADLAILVLPDKVLFGRFIKPICLWERSKDPKASKGVLVGWGQGEDKTKSYEPIPNELEVPILTNEDCFFHTAKLAEISSNRTFCAGSADGSGACLGDSGNGLFIEHDSVLYIRGIVSSAMIKSYTCDVTKYAIYTNVLKYKQWITTLMIQYSDSKFLD